MKHHYNDDDDIDVPRFQKSQVWQRRKFLPFGYLSRLERHIKSVGTALKQPKACMICGGCGVPRYFIPTKGKHVGKM